MRNCIMETLLEATGNRGSIEHNIINMDKRQYELYNPENVWVIFTAFGKEYECVADSKEECQRLFEQLDVLDDKDHILDIVHIGKKDVLPLDDNDEPVHIICIK